MRAEPTLTAMSAPRARRRDLGAAIALAAILTFVWTIAAWADLRWFTLPDSDDMMRLAQIRDWIAGQRFDDWTQYRLAPPVGGPMHWSRINDLGIAAVIVVLRPLFGTHTAELTAIILYPAILFAACLYLAARIARAIAGAAAAPVAIVVMAVAYPANSLFLPGRIDHHAIEIVLAMTATLALTSGRGWRGGAVAGAALGIALGVGLEVAPQAAAAVTVVFAFWAICDAAERPRLAGFAGALVATTVLLLAAFRPSYWSAEWCDAFTPASSTATMAGGLAMLALAAGTPWLRTLPIRAATGLALGGATLGAVLWRFPACLTGPYGPMDPFVRHAFMENVIEARGLFAQDSPGTALPVMGMMAVASVAGAVLAWRDRRHWRRWLPILALLAMSDAVMIVQVRGAYFGSAIAAPVLAAMIVAARSRVRYRAISVATAWLASAGMVWLVVPAKVSGWSAPGTAVAKQVHKACKAGDTWHQLDRWPAGVVMAPMDMAAYVIGGSHHASVAAGYHRSNRGNRAMYDFFLAPPEQARAIGASWNTRYVAICRTDFSELNVDRAYPGSLATALIEGRPPAWLEPLPLRDTGLAFYRVR